MSAEKKPFAEVVPVRLNPGAGLPDAWVLQVGERTVTQGDEKAMQRLADRINAAVEAREAKLRGALSALSRKLEERIASTASDRINWQRDHACAQCGPIIGPADGSFVCARHTALAVLAGTGPDYVPRAEFDAVKAKLEGTWAVLADALNEEGGKFGPQAMALFEALGLKPTAQPSVFRFASVLAQDLATIANNSAKDEGDEYHRALTDVVAMIADRTKYVAPQTDSHALQQARAAAGVVGVAQEDLRPDDMVEINMTDGTVRLTQVDQRAAAVLNFAAEAGRAGVASVARTMADAERNTDAVTRRWVYGRWRLIAIVGRGDGNGRRFGHQFEGPAGDTMEIIAPDEGAAREELRRRLASIRENGTRPSGFVLTGVE